MDVDSRYQYDTDSVSLETVPDDTITVAQLQHLIQVLDQSSVFELEVTRPGSGTRLVLRKATDVDTHQGVSRREQDSSSTPSDDTPVAEPKHTIVAPLVGIFHSWAKPKGGPVVAVGDHVKVGQVVGTIQSLNVLNEIETSVAGRVAEILVQNGQAVEYGQPLIVIESVEEI